MLEATVTLIFDNWTKSTQFILESKLTLVAKFEKRKKKSLKVFLRYHVHEKNENIHMQPQKKK